MIGDKWLQYSVFIFQHSVPLSVCDGDDDFGEDDTYGHDGEDGDAYGS